MMKTVVELQKVSFTYGCHPVLNDVSLVIEAGELVGIVGPNGAGKSTLLKLIMGQLKPNQGYVKIFGSDPCKLKEKYRIGYVAQKASYFNHQFPATVREVVISGRAARRGLFRPFTSHDHQLVEQTLELVGLKDISNQPVGRLSGGQQQRVFIARALVSEPEILIFDEPTVGVDAAAQTAFYKLLQDLNQRKNMTMLMVSHELEGLSSIITRQVCLNRHICSCNCHNYTAPSLQEENCSKRLAFQVAK